MDNTALLLRANNTSLIETVETEHFTPIEIISSKPHELKVKHFIEANTLSANMIHLRNDCTVPVFSKDNEITISHPDFIETVWDAANNLFKGETISEPEIRVSHIIKGRTPEAIHKPVSQLLESDKTIYYERMAFCFEIPSIYETIEGNRLNLSIGGVRAYNNENLYSKKTAEKFKVFIGFKNLVCCNMCVSTDGYKAEIKAMSCYDLLKAASNLFSQYNPLGHLQMMAALGDSYLTEHQFAQFIGKTRLYQCLPSAKKKNLPEMLLTDSQINLVAKAYYQDENFAGDKANGTLNLWRLYNLLTGANKSSYIDNFLDRSLNASILTEGISKALTGDITYEWFIS